MLLFWMMPTLELYSLMTIDRWSSERWTSRTLLLHSHSAAAALRQRTVAALKSRHTRLGFGRVLSTATHDCIFWKRPVEGRGCVDYLRVILFKF